MKQFFTAVVLMVLCFPAVSQRMVSGKIIAAETRKQISGATVTLKGTSTATMSDFDGEFTIDVPEAGGTLVVKAYGYQETEIEIGARSVLDIVLQRPEDQSKPLTTGFGSLTKQENTGSVTQVNTESIGNQPVINLEQANQGRASGVFTKNSGGKLGSGSTVRIRGGSSLTGNNEPLYVVDGVPLSSGNQSDINPANIASIEVLKDASATALYGSRAANGVILITTKTGQTGKMKVDADYQFGVSTTPRRLALMNPTQYREQFLEFGLRTIQGHQQFITRDSLTVWAARNSANFNLPDGTQVRNFRVPALDSLTYNTDWQDIIFRTAYTHQANLNLTGGNNRTQYYTGLGFMSQQGILIGNSYDRLNARFNVTSKISSKLTATAGISYAMTIDNKLPDDQDLGSPLQAIVLPSADAPDPNNNFFLRVRRLDYNPQTEIRFSDYRENANQMVANASLIYQMTDQLNWQTDLGIDYFDGRLIRRQGPQTLEGRPTGFSRLREANTFNYVVNSYLNYTRKSEGVHTINSVVGVSYQRSQSTVTFRSARVNSIRELENKTENDPDLFNPPVPGSAFAFASVFARATYSYDSRYVVQFSGRMDGSSRFGTANRYGFFPALSAGWNISNESFLADNRVVSFLKLKASYGLVGNTPDDDFLYRTNYFTVFYRNDPALRLANLANANLKWETTTLTDFGLEFGFMDDRISGEVAVYRKSTSDLIFPIPVSNTSGFSSVLRNVGSMQNQGVELSLSSVNVETKYFSWTTDFNIAFNENKITSIEGRRLISGVNAFIEGQPIGAFFMPVYVGVDPTSGLALYENGFGGTTTNYQEAVNNGRRVVGNPNPKYFGGMGNNLTYKNVELSFFLQFTGGVDMYNRTGEFLANSGILNLGQLASQVDRWYQPGDEAKYPRVNPFQENTQPSTRWLENGSFVRLLNTNIGYDLTSDRLKAKGVSSMKIFVGGQNLFTLTNYTGYDPDVNYIDPEAGTIGANINRGIDDFTAPQPRIVYTGIKVRF